MKKLLIILLGSTAILPSKVALTQTVEGFGRGLFEKEFSFSAAVPLLNTFEFQYVVGNNLATRVDHHISQILIKPFSSPGKIELGFHDKNKDDRFFYRVSHHNLLDTRIVQSSRRLDICSQRGKCTVRLERPEGEFVFVLIGFQLSFRSVDHHIDEIGIIENDGELTVSYNDRNDDDLFVWSVQFAYVPKDLFSEIGVSSGTREQRGASRSINPGKSVVRGFKFDFKPYFTSGGDHHIRAISVRGPDRRIEVLYTDKNGDDGFDWQVNWGILR